MTKDKFRELNGENNNVELSENKKIYKTISILSIVILIFPIIINKLSNQSNNDIIINITEIIKENIGYYGTALSIIFTIIIFTIEYNFQKQKERERKEKDHKELIVEKKKEIELQLKEIEDRNNYYRPSFIISNNEVKVLMRESDLIIENVVFYSDETNEVPKGLMKSGDLVYQSYNGESLPSQFYIFANTILGESILFGFLFGELKVYKYLKINGNLLYPRGKSDDNYKTNKIEANWASYNNYKFLNNEQNYNTGIESYFFYETQYFRERIFFNSFKVIRSLIDIESNIFFRRLFEILQTEYTAYNINDNSIINIILFIENFIQQYPFIFEVDTTKIDKKNMIGTTIEERLTVYIPNYHNIFETNDILDIINIFDWITNILFKSKNNKDRREIYKSLLLILIEVFKYTEVDTSIKQHLLYLRNEILKRLEFEKRSD